jgi:Na+-translocating ferredoxin:NAD+ oxidoreductase RNF subunit RnfB
MKDLICAQINWANVGMVLGIIGGLAILLGALILIVTKVCHIEEDEKVTQILQNLSGANCGGCGHSGCAGFAKALAEGKANLSDCHSTSESNKKIIAQLTGLPFNEGVPTVAVVKCNGGLNSFDKYNYLGNKECTNQIILLGGKKYCSTGCLGGGTCESVCPVGAITVKNNLARVDKTLCISCGACVTKCPKNCIDWIPITAKVFIACSSHCRGKEVTTTCANGCIACGICAKNCPQNAITMVNNLPVIDYEKCNGCMVCVEKCPRKCIHVYNS